MLTQFRLYLAAGVLVIILGLAVLAFWYRGQAIDATAQRDRARADLAVAAEANREAQKTIGALQEQARMDNRLTAELVAEMRRINQTLAEQSAALTELEKANADVRAYLDTAVPADLRRLYHR